MFSKALLFFNLALAATAITNPQKVKAVAASSRPQAYQSKVPAGLYQLYPQDKSGAVSDKGGDTLVSTMWTRGAAGNQIFRITPVGGKTGQEVYQIQLPDEKPARPIQVKNSQADKAVAVGSRGRAPTKWQFRFLNRAKYNRDCFQILIPGVNLAWTSADPSLNKTDPAVEPRITLGRANAADPSQRFCLLSQGVDTNSVS